MIRFLLCVPPLVHLIVSVYWQIFPNWSSPRSLAVVAEHYLKLLSNEIINIYYVWRCVKSVLTCILRSYIISVLKKTKTNQRIKNVVLNIDSLRSLRLSFFPLNYLVNVDVSQKYLIPALITGSVKRNPFRFEILRMNH